MNEKYGSWTVVSDVVIGEDNRHRYKCRCDCGVVKDVLAYELKRGKTTKCRQCCRITLDIGSKFGCYTVLECAGVNQKRSAVFKCRCDCGAESIVPGITLRKFPPNYCNKCPRNIVPIGEKYGEWTIIGFEDIYKYKSRWRVRCSCGEECIVNSNNIIRGVSTRCYKCKNKELKKITGRCFAVNISEETEVLNQEKIENIPLQFWNRLKDGATKRKIEFNITENDLVNLFNEQKGKCVFTGWNLVIDKNGKKCTASLDRIDSEQGYSADNIQFVHKHINLMKNAFLQEYFIKMCKAVVKHGKDEHRSVGVQ